MQKYEVKKHLAAKSLQSCSTLCDHRDDNPPGSPVPGILQARTLEWVAISFSNAWKWKGKVKSLSCVQLLVTPWIAAYQAPPSMGFSRQEYWSGVPTPSLKPQLRSYLTLDINPLSDIWFANKFSHSIGCLFILFVVSVFFLTSEETVTKIQKFFFFWLWHF